MQFKPKSEKEIALNGLWPDGFYEFEVTEAEETTSQAGNDMVKLKIKVYNDEGASRTVYDYLVGTESAQFKVRGFASAVGLIDQYESGNLDAVEMEGRTGKCKLVIQKDRNGSFPDKNAIGAYVAQAEKPKAPAPSRSVAKPAERRQPAMAVSRDLDDEIPF